jgi:hypothetical protein
MRAATPTANTAVTAARRLAGFVLHTLLLAALETWAVARAVGLAAAGACLALAGALVHLPDLDE